MKSMGSHGSSSLLGIHDEMFQHFVCDFHKVMTAFIVKLPSNLLLWRFLCNCMDMPLFAALEPWDEKETSKKPSSSETREVEKKP